jgi:hypothetical protein
LWYLVTGSGTLTTTNLHEPNPSLHTTTTHHQPEPSLLTTTTHLQPDPSLTHLFPCIDQTIPTQRQTYPSPLNLKHQPGQPPMVPAKVSDAHQDSCSHHYSIPLELHSCMSTKQTSSTQLQITVPAKASNAHHDSGPPYPPPSSTQLRIHPNPLNLKHKPGQRDCTIPTKASDAHHLSGSHGSCTTKKQTGSHGSCMTKKQTPTPIMTKVPKENTRSLTALKKKNDSAVDELQQQVAMEKKKQTDKKKERVEEKKAEEERQKKSDEEKAKANTVTISPPNVNDTTAGLDTMVLNADNKYIAQTDDWTEAEDTEPFARFGISPNHLFGIKAEKTITTTTTEPTTKEAGTAAPDDTATVNLTAPENSPRERELRTPTHQAQLRRATGTPQRASALQQRPTVTTTRVPLWKRPSP